VRFASPVETLTKAMPTEGVTPRASLIAQMISWFSLPPIEDAQRDFRPDAVLRAGVVVNLLLLLLVLDR
jgi:hypothetical protein